MMRRRRAGVGWDLVDPTPPPVARRPPDSPPAPARSEAHEILSELRCSCAECDAAHARLAEFADRSGYEPVYELGHEHPVDWVKVDDRTAEQVIAAVDERIVELEEAIERARRDLAHEPSERRIGGLGVRATGEAPPFDPDPELVEHLEQPRLRRHPYRGDGTKPDYRRKGKLVDPQKRPPDPGRSAPNARKPRRRRGSHTPPRGYRLMRHAPGPLWRWWYGRAIDRALERDRQIAAGEIPLKGETR